MVGWFHAKVADKGRPNAASNRFRSSIAMSEVSPIAPSGLRGSRRVGEILRTAPTALRTVWSRLSPRLRRVGSRLAAVVAPHPRPRRPLCCRQISDGCARRAPARTPPNRSAERRELAPPIDKANETGPPPRAGGIASDALAAEFREFERSAAAFHQAGVFPDAPADADGRQSTRSAILRQSVEARVRGRVVRLSGLRHKGCHGRHQRKELDLRQKTVKVLGAPQFGTEEGVEACPADGVGQTVVDGSGRVNDAAYRGPCFGIVAVEECPQRSFIADVDGGHMDRNPLRLQRADSCDPLPYNSV